MNVSIFVLRIFYDFNLPALYSPTHRLPIIYLHFYGLIPAHSADSLPVVAVQFPILLSQFFAFKAVDFIVRTGHDRKRIAVFFVYLLHKNALLNNNFSIRFNNDEIITIIIIHAKIALVLKFTFSF